MWFQWIRAGSNLEKFEDDSYNFDLFSSFFRSLHYRSLFLVFHHVFFCEQVNLVYVFASMLGYWIIILVLYSAQTFMEVDRNNPYNPSLAFLNTFGFSCFLMVSAMLKFILYIVFFFFFFPVFFFRSEVLISSFYIWDPILWAFPNLFVSPPPSSAYLLYQANVSTGMVNVMMNTLTATMTEFIVVQIIYISFNLVSGAFLSYKIRSFL